MAENATPKPITRTRPVIFPKQQTVMVTDDEKKAIERAAAAESARTGARVSQSDIARRWLEAGRTMYEAARGVDAG